MKTMNLNEMGVKEMSISEMKETEGGLLLIISLFYVVKDVVVALLNDKDEK